MQEIIGSCLPAVASTLFKSSQVCVYAKDAFGLSFFFFFFNQTFLAKVCCSSALRRGFKKFSEAIWNSSHSIYDALMFIAPNLNWGFNTLADIHVGSLSQYLFLLTVVKL